MARKSSFTSTRARIKLRRILTETDARIKPAMQDAANGLMHEVIARVPRDTGNLEDNITSLVSKNGLTAQIGIRGKKARSRAFYARFLEFGTKGEDGGTRMAAQPFLQPAWDYEKPKIINRIEKVINDAVKKAQGL